MPDAVPRYRTRADLPGQPVLNSGDAVDAAVLASLFHRDFQRAGDYVVAPLRLVRRHDAGALRQRHLADDPAWPNRAPLARRNAPTNP